MKFDYSFHFFPFFYFCFYFYSDGKIPGPECGREHSCAGNRTGPNCTQPDMWPNQSMWKKYMLIIANSTLQTNNFIIIN